MASQRRLDDSSMLTNCTFCTLSPLSVTAPVARKRVEVKRIPMSNDFMSMEFIQGRPYES